MTKIIKIIGSIIFSCVMYSLPILTTCSFCFDWDGFSKMILLICSCGQLMALIVWVYYKAEEGE